MNHRFSIAALAVLALAGGTAGCSHAAPTPVPSSANAAQVAASTKVPGSINGAELVQMWNRLRMPCPDPGPSLPAGSRATEEALGDQLPTIQSVATALANTTATVPQEQVVALLQQLRAALLQVRAAMVDRAERSPDGARDELLKPAREAFDKFQTQVISALRGQGKLDPDLIDRFDINTTCPVRR
ncbi:hypothetical protein [Segniliparus rugosus]|uniref:Lipoprotein n=1 Tax=Segniliparus rugosus (strain ATCC BAA-974 / DSM 45345 / CCUG 50838 / CIP 108380 / JCM 13579 / CDC 945) TaxID=679197 RepID=E5XLN7_SEGRC|nr:hypothetical protein [Segniliparus rugosus]EFV14715.1 hypothetical protein HMPREF9336_00406 [Segniliparus rugosus ATCC BAA-974]